MRCLLYTLLVFVRALRSPATPWRSVEVERYTYPDAYSSFRGPSLISRAPLNSSPKPSPYSMASQTKVVAVDIDEVLCHFIPGLAEFHNSEYGGTLTSESFVSYQFHEVWGGTESDCVVKMETFFQSDYFLKDLNPVDGAYEALKALKETFPIELHLVTARQLTLEEQTKAWISKHYPDLFTDIHFGNHYSSSGKKRSKPEMCKEIKAVCLIDDSQVYAGQCAKENIPTILFGNYAWNKRRDEAGGEEWAVSMEVLSKVKRASNWNECIALVKQTISEELNANPVIAAIQLCASNNKAENLAKIGKIVSDAATIGKATFISLPEACCFIGASAEDTLQNGAETMEGLCVSTMKSLCLEYKIWLQVGGVAILVEQEEDGDEVNQPQQQYYNRALLINPEGEIVSSYDKIHLFNNPLTGMFESKYTKAGNSIESGIVSQDASGFFCAMAQTICYDMRFPEVYRKLKNEHGIELCTIPSAFMEKTGEAHWEVLLRARAIENQMYIVAAAQIGLHNPANSKRCSWGQTMIISPWGDIISALPSIKDIKNKNATEDGMEGYCIASFDRQKIANLARAMPVKDHQQQHLY